MSAEIDAQLPERPVDGLVSIVTPTLNRAPFLEANLASVAGQSYANIEHLVIDGGSTDNSVGILQAVRDPRVRWISEPDQGMDDAVNKGLRMARGEIVAYLNSDDLYLPWAVEAAVTALRALPDAAAVYGHAIRTDDHGHAWPWLQAPFSPSATAAWGSLIQPAVFWRRDVHYEVGWFDEGLRFVADLDFWLRVARRHRLVSIDEFLAIDQSHAGAASRAMAAAMATEDRRMRDRHRRGVWAAPGAPLLARARSSVLRRGVWLRLMRAASAKPDTDAWRWSRQALGLHIPSGPAIAGLVPGLGLRALSGVAWRTDPWVVATGGGSAGPAVSRGR